MQFSRLPLLFADICLNERYISKVVRIRKSFSSPLSLFRTKIDHHDKFEPAEAPNDTRRDGAFFSPFFFFFFFFLHGFISFCFSFRLSPQKNVSFYPFTHLFYAFEALPAASETLPAAFKAPPALFEGLLAASEDLPATFEALPALRPVQMPLRPS